MDRMKICFVTSNRNKVREFQEILKGAVELEHVGLAYPELRSDDPEEIAMLAAKQLADKLKKTVIVEDSGLFITALNGFPGTCSAYIHKRIGLQGILKLMENKTDRTCFYRSAVGYCKPNQEPVSFLGEEQCAIAAEIRGKNGFGHDPIVIPEGSTKTYAEMDTPEKQKKFRRLAVEKLLEFLG